ncbi:hypothetical protein L3Q65_01035 (plasmid) [Amycolatopsis sp. FU40]|uniref:hypothetical protein n=1 Tax=Amycolatopsis sp. FU40 TaxID=2914159 RepID=UPI001F26AA64|nr:hypothetical protein [Amycolatopsis sp. FU40]UKD50910.1 hypothetical protein L3Q65_01035 [Amycolatopsis sp. FU40]
MHDDIEPGTNRRTAASSPTLLPSDVDTIEAAAEDFWICRCGNKPHGSGFVPVDRHGTEVDPTPSQWPELLYRCNGCGLVMDGSTVDTMARTVAVIGRIV